MIYETAARSLVGKIRCNNEDNYCIDEHILDLKHDNAELYKAEYSSDQPHFFGVFDGMGGHSRGEEASYVTALTMKERYPTVSKEDDFNEVLHEICMKANDDVCDIADGSRMGTTCAMLCFREDLFTLCNVGDSPIFRLRDGMLRQLSVDHNQRATYERATGKPAEPGKKFKLTQCIGIPSDEMLIEPFITAGRLEDGDVFLLCSDGITDMVDNETIQTVLSGDGTAEEMVRKLSDMAMEAGGRDNITLICVKVSGTAPARGLRGIIGRLFGI